MKMPQEPPQEMTVQQSVNLTYFVCQCLATVVTPFIHVGFGREALGFRGLGALVILLLWGGLNKSGITLQYLVLWLAALVIQRCVTLGQWMTQRPVHSLYAGDPWLVGLVCRREWLVRLLIEPALIVGTGYLVFGLLSPTLGKLLMASGAAMWLAHSLEDWAEAVRIGSLSDARIEMEHLSRLYRRR
jgi:hypothetical protein